MVMLLLIGALAAAANAQSLQFEVASIKLNKVPNGDGSFTISPKRLTAHNTFLGVLIMRAYHMDQSQFPELFRSASRSLRPGCRSRPPRRAA